MKSVGESIWSLCAAMFVVCLAHDLGVFLIHGADAIYWFNWK